MSISRSKEDVYSKSKLSIVQCALWLTQKLQPDTPQYNSPVCLWVHGPLDLERFRQAFQAYIDRTDAMRMIVIEEDGIPQPKVLDSVQYTVPVNDFSAAENPRMAAREWAVQRALRCFDLEQPLFDVALSHLGGDDWCFYINQHHLIMDGWSFPLMTLRLKDLYEAIGEGTLDQVEPYPSFLEYLERKFSERQGYDADKAAELLKEKLGDRKEPLRLYGVSTLETNNRTHRERMIYEVDDTDRLAELCEMPEFKTKSKHASQFNIFATAYAACLQRVSNAHRLSIGTMHHNRFSFDLQAIHGVFVSAMPMKFDVRHDDTFATLHERLRTEAIASRDRSRELLEAGVLDSSFDVMINYQVITDPPFPVPIEPGDWIFTGYGREAATVQVLYSITWRKFVLYFELSDGVFDESARKRFPQHFTAMLRAMLKNPHQMISEVEIVTEEEKEFLLKTVNKTATPFEEATTATAVIEARAKLVPDSVAMYFNGSAITYREMDERSNQIACTLIEDGVQPESIVGICLDRSPEMITAMLAVMKAGAAYLPLDPAYPEDRLSFMLTDSGSPYLITCAALENHVPHACQKVLCVDTDRSRIDSMSTTALPALAGPDSAAYVIYTSGSTGKPKGAVLEHRGLCNQFVAHALPVGITARTRLLQFASICFDASVVEIFVTLAAGARLYLAPRSVLESPSQLTSFIREHAIDTVTLAPTMLNMLEPEALPGLTTIISAGERLPATVANRWSPGRRLLNGYGPTENTVCTTMHQCEGVYTQSPPIGRPVPNNEVYVLNEARRLSPLGTPGELFVTGPGLARGYLNRDDLTRAKFHANEYSGAGRGRMYQTGDLVRMHADGNLEFLSRVDDQVKVHGYRIELGEVENAMESHEDVMAAAAMVHEIDGNARLIGYVHVHEGSQTTPSELRKFLLDRLPPFMAPSAIMVVDSFPLLPNGKVDRAQLPPPEHGHTEVDAVFKAPRTACEAQLARIWESVFDHAPIGVLDNFYDLGGDSLTAIQIIERARTEGLNLSPYDLFQHPTIELLAEFVQPFETSSGDSMEDLPLIPAQLRGMEQDTHREAQCLHVRLHPSTSVEKTDAALKAIIRRHEALRFQRVRENGSWKQREDHVNSDGLIEWLHVSDMSESAVSERINAVLASMIAPSGPAFYALGIQTKGEIQLRLFGHGAMMDRRSWQLIEADLHAELTGQVDLHEVQGRSQGIYAKWLRRIHASTARPDLQTETAYWHDLLMKPATALPRDAEPVVSATESIVGTADVSALAPGPAQNELMETVFIAAVAKAVEEWTGANSLLFDVFRDARNAFADQSLTRTVGQLTFNHPLRIDPPKNVGVLKYV
ncbi:MAG: hypothetical protein AMXMBFR84_16210 [Candidatus Hydrogenedentota bacterium]